MGWIKLAIASAIGIYSYRSVTRVNQVVRAIYIPTYTLHGSHTELHKVYKDAFKTELPRRFKLVKGIGSREEVSVTDLARAFFSSRLFQLEKRILTTLLGSTASTTSSIDIINYNKFKFNVGDEFLCWRVVERKPNEILLKWEYGQLKGTTWFYVPHDENCIVFGSSFPSPPLLNDKPKLKDFLDLTPKELFIEGSRNLPDGIPARQRLRFYLLGLAFRVSVPVHTLYSKYLLASALNRLVEVKK